MVFSDRLCFFRAVFLSYTLNTGGVGESLDFQTVSLSDSVLSLSLSFCLSITCVCKRVSGVIYGCVVPSAVEGEYCPWEKELQQGLWLQHLSNEEDTGTFKGTRIPSPLPFPRRRGECFKEQVPHEKFLSCT